MPYYTVPTQCRAVDAPPQSSRRALRLVVDGSQREAERVEEPVAPAPEELLWRQVDELAGAVRVARDGDAVPQEEQEEEDELLEVLAFSELYETLTAPGGPAELRRTGHPEVGTVLEAAAGALPDPRMAREARKQALKARTFRACGG